MILYQQHIMWYESKMINETLDSLQASVLYSSIPVHFKFCLNAQTYLESPINGTAKDMFDEFLNHPILKKSDIIFKTDNDPFYNIADWRRETYSKDYKYVVWGESDCLLPEDYFYILSNIKIDEPHVLTLSSRIMWDDSWTIVEHLDLKKFPNLDYQKPSYENLIPFRYYDYINQKELNDFNEKNEEIEIIKLDSHKIDGSLLALSSNLPSPFIAPNMNFIQEDTCAAYFFYKKNIPQYHITNKIKGHNYYHPLKRTNTNSNRADEIYKKYANLSIESMNKFLNSL